MPLSRLRHPAHRRVFFEGLGLRRLSLAPAGLWGLEGRDGRSNQGSPPSAASPDHAPPTRETHGPIYRPRDTSRFRLLTHPLGPTALSPNAPCWYQRFVRVVRQGAPSRAQRKVLDRAQELGRDDVTRWRPARCIPSSRRRPPAGHPDGPLRNIGSLPRPPTPPSPQRSTGAAHRMPQPQNRTAGPKAGCSTERRFFGYYL